MLCQICNKNIATVHFTQIVNGSKVDMYLCERCANQKNQIVFESPISVHDFLMNIIGHNQLTANYLEHKVHDIRCNVCGTSYEDFKKTGKLGCRNCYSVLEERLYPIIRRLHGNATHKGKVPVKNDEEINYYKRIEELKEELSRAIQLEEYEQAAKLRDIIRDLESKL